MHQLPDIGIPRYHLPKRGESHYPRLTLLAMLAAVDPKIAHSLLSDPLEHIRITHPHYSLTLESQDYVTLAGIRARAKTVSEFLMALAEIVDGTPSTNETIMVPTAYEPQPT